MMVTIEIGVRADMQGERFQITIWRGTSGEVRLFKDYEECQRELLDLLLAAQGGAFKIGRPPGIGPRIVAEIEREGL